MDGKKLQSRSPLLTLRVEQSTNGTLVASIIPQKKTYVQDDLGALYYVVAVILIYGCSIVMMIASYIRKNKDDQRLKRCLKEMAFVRKRELHMSIMWAATKAATLRRNAIIPGQGGEAAVEPPSGNPSGPEPGQPETDTSGLLEPTVWVKQTSENLNAEEEMPLIEAPSVTASLAPDDPSSKVMTLKMKPTSGLGRRSIDSQMVHRPSLEVSSSRRSSIQVTVPRMTLPKLLLTAPKNDAKVNAGQSPTAEGPEEQLLCDRKQPCRSLQVISIL